MLINPPVKKIGTAMIALGLLLASSGAWAADQDDDKGEKTVKEKVPAAWATLDANNDGVLTREEVEATPWEQKFEEMDANDDGKVTKKEFAEYEHHMRKEQKKQREQAH